MSDTNKILSHKLFLQREHAITHLPYEQELTFYNAVKNGDTKKLKELLLPLKDEQLGKLSENPLRNLKYHLTIAVAMVTRFCIEGGMPPETAYTLSDLYIQQLDLCETEDALSDLHKKIIFDYANRMKRLKKQNIYSQPIVKAMDYIYEHLQEKILLEDLAGYLNMNKSYLCTLFKKETGMTIGNYITKLKIEAAGNMLLYADYSPSAISNYFAFSSHSHFIKAFKKETGMTPKEYRNRYYRSTFLPK